MREKVNLFFKCLAVLAILLLTSCESNQAIVNNIDEREANEIVVFLASKGIPAQKVAAVSTGAGAATGPQNMYNITVPEDQSTDAMSLLNRYGLPRRQGTNLLTLFAKSGLMSSDKEETIRYQAGLAEQLKNTIVKIDGVIDADVQISFPTSEETALPGAPKEKITAAVYVKHQGVLDDPNTHIETKIKRLMAGSVNGLEFDNVSVISDRARFADIVLKPEGQMIGSKNLKQTYASIWSIVMTKSSLTRFRVIFFGLIILVLLFAAALAWLIYKFYPQMQFFKKKKEEPPEET